jgi:hypothetical protein
LLYLIEIGNVLLRKELLYERRAEMNRETVRIGVTRSVHLIDAENLCGASLITPRDVAELRNVYFASVEVGPLDHFILAASHASVLALQAGWPGGRYLMQSGKNGADIQLATVVVGERLHDRFDHVYFGSGDGGLAPFAAFLGGRGVTVTAVSRRQSLSPRMKLATAGVIYLNRPGIASLHSI